MWHINLITRCLKSHMRKCFYRIEARKCSSAKVYIMDVCSAMKTCLGVLDAGTHSYARADVLFISVLCFLVIHYFSSYYLF